MEIIKFENVCYEYGGAENENVVKALNGINLTINKGEFVCVVGRNGSGKSTLAKLMNALILPTGGHVFVKGRDTLIPENVYKARQTAGMVFQNPDNQIIASIVSEDVAFGPENLGFDSTEIKQRVAYALKCVGLEKLYGEATHFLSGGQKQKLAIAGVLAMRPEVIVLDEPTAMLDPIGREDVLRALVALNRGKRITVVLITHFMNEAALGDVVYIMNEGEIVLGDTPKNVFSKVDFLRKTGLDAPEMAQLGFALREAGLRLPEGILTVDEMAEALCCLKRKT